MFRRLVSTSASWAPVPLRLAMGAVFIGHGAQKVFGSFNGPGFQTWTSISPPLSFMRPSWLWLGAAAVAELVGGVLILLGLLTRAGAFMILCVMLAAIAGVHWPSFFVPKGIEYPMSLVAVSLALMIMGGGIASIDRSLSARRR
jgi:putative oxidoreductase